MQNNFWAFLVLLAVAVIAVAEARNSGQFTAPGCGPNSRFDDCSDGCVPTCDSVGRRIIIEKGPLICKNFPKGSLICNSISILGCGRAMRAN